jgi:hypothetical protein
VPLTLGEDLNCPDPSIDLGSTIDTMDATSLLCYRRPHVQEVLGTKLINIRKNSLRKYKYFDCKVTNCPNSRNRVEFNYNVSGGYRKIKPASIRTTTPILPMDVATFGLKRQASLPKTSTIVDNLVTQTSTEH